MIHNDMADEQLGKVVRTILEDLQGMPGDASGIRAIAGAAGALSIISLATEHRAEDLVLRVKEMTRNGEGIGDWVVHARRADYEDTGDLGPHLLRGWLHPDRIQQAVNSFSKLTQAQIEAPHTPYRPWWRFWK